MTLKHIEPYSKLNLFFIGVLLFIIAFFYFQGTSAGFVFVIFIVILLYRKGLEIDLKKERHRKTMCFFGMNIGVWRPLPKIKYISVFKTIKSSRLRGKTAETTYGFVVYKVNLFQGQNKHLEIYITEDKSDAFKLAKQIALVLNLEVFDATEN